MGERKKPSPSVNGVQSSSVQLAGFVNSHTSDVWKEEKTSYHCVNS